MISGVPSNPERAIKLITFLSINMTFLASIIFMIYQMKTYFTIWLQYIIAFVLILDFLIIIYAFFYDKIYNFLNLTISGWKRNRLAKKHFLELKYLVETFSDSIERNDGIPKVLDELRSQKEEFRYLIVPQKNEIINLLFDLQEYMKRFDKTAGDFKNFNNQFHDIIKIYNEFWMNRPLNDVRSILEVQKQGSIPENIKKKYNESKVKYEKFLDKYEEFGNRVNKEFGGRIVNTYLDQPKEL
jgi:hypothetical protein